VRIRQRRAVALTIAGSDSGGGAGIQADLKTFAALGVHGTSVVTCVTAQNPARVAGIHGCPALIVEQQLAAILSELPPAAVKTGMLFSRSIIRAVIEFFKAQTGTPLVVDPVMIATSGSSLLQRGARRELEDLLSLATLVTPNVDEARALTGLAIVSEEDLRTAARHLQSRFGCAALVKGGHLRRGQQAVDIFFDGQTELLLSAPLISNVATHGTGCTYAAAITAYLARGAALIAAVQKGKEFITQAIASGYLANEHFSLNSLWAQRGFQ
jgi:hydroxymethylpyrimidine/phosphomethylpyrimidine kinase